MSSVTFPTNLGGNGQTYTDDDNPSTGLRDGGWRSRFVPCLEQTVAIADALTNRVIFGSDVSSSSLAVSTGSKTLTTSGSYNWAVGMFVTIARTSAPTANYMFGQVVSYNASTDQLVVNVTSVTGSGTYTDWTIAIAPPGLAPSSFTGPTTIAVSSSSDALRITQTGSGNALVVEDSANPDSTPFVINTDGKVGIGLGGGGIFGDAGIQMQAESSSGPATFYLRRAETASGASSVFFDKLRGTFASPIIVNSGDSLGNLIFRGYDGSGNISAAQIIAAVDGTPGTNDMPGRLVFSTTADGASSPTEKMRINNAGNVLVGRAFVSGGERLGIGGNTSSISTTTSAIGILNDTAVSSAQTNLYTGYNTFLSTSAASFTLAGLRHFSAFQSTIGAGSTVTNQYGFFVDASLTGATNNYGFYSSIASGSGRYNFYAAGTADNYFAGAVGIGGAPNAGRNLEIRKSLTGSAYSYQVNNEFSILSDVTTEAVGYHTYISTQAAAFTLTNLRHFKATQSTIGAGSTVSYQMGFLAENNLTGASVTNFGFYSAIPSGSGRFNFYAAGTADNYFAGAVGIGILPTYTNASILIARTDGTAQAFFARSTADTGAFILRLYKSRSTSIYSRTIVQNNDNLGFINFSGDDGVSELTAAIITAAVDGTPGTNDMPGRLVFSTTADGASSPTERMRIDNAGRVGIGGTPFTDTIFGIYRHSTGGTTVHSFRTLQTVQSDVTATAAMFQTVPSTAAASFNLNFLKHYVANQGTIGLGSTVSNQFGFIAEASLTGATNNYGFYSNIASGSGRYNFYAAGTAENYFAGITGVGGLASGIAGTQLLIAGSVTGSVNSRFVYCNPLFSSDVTNAARGFQTALTTAAASFTIANMAHFQAQQGTFGAGSAVGSQYGFEAQSSLTGATNNYGFYSNIASGSGRYNFYAAGTADNYFAGNVKTDGTLAGGYSALSAGTTAMGLASDKVVKVTPNATATFTTTVAPAGATASIIVVTSGTTSYTITFGTGFLTTGTLATGTVTAKTFVISFVSDGTTMIETSRTVAM